MKITTKMLRGSSRERGGKASKKRERLGVGKTKRMPRIIDDNDDVYIKHKNTNKQQKAPKYPIGFEFDVKRSYMRRLETGAYIFDFEEAQRHQIVGYTYTKRGNIKYISKRIDIEGMFTYPHSCQDIDGYVWSEKFRKENEARMKGI